MRDPLQYGRQMRRGSARVFHYALGVLALAFADAVVARAQSPQVPGAASALKLEAGKQIYDAGCVSCHGRDGKGQSQNLKGFEPPPTFPDFSDCPTSTPEPNVQWRAVITNGGPARSFSSIMPAFGDLLNAAQIDKVIDYVRGLCTEHAWPRGDLNLPRALVTEKAFPEDETVVTSSINAQGDPGVSSNVIYEHRIGATAMMEVNVPYAFTND